MKDTVIDTPTPRDTCTSRPASAPLRAVKPNMAGAQAPRPSASPRCLTLPWFARPTLLQCLLESRRATPVFRHPGSRRGPWMGLLGRRLGLQRQPRASRPCLWEYCRVGVHDGRVGAYLHCHHLGIFHLVPSRATSRNVDLHLHMLATKHARCTLRPGCRRSNGC